MNELKRVGQVSGGDIISKQSPERLSIDRSDLSPREVDLGETEIILQRHGKYERNKNDKNAGSLTESAREEERKASEEFMIKQLEMIPENERNTIDFLFIGSDTKYENGQRSLETASIALEVARNLVKKYELNDDQIINNSPKIKGGDNARPMPMLREPNMFEEHWNFVQFLKNKYDKGGEGLGKDFWIAFEEDIEKEKREKMGVEGPDELANRLQKSYKILSRFARMYHSKKPERRLIIWATSHYDTISPYAKRKIYNKDLRTPVGVDYGAGIVIKINKENQADTIINKKRHKIVII